MQRNRRGLRYRDGTAFSAVAPIERPVCFSPRNGNNSNGATLFQVKG